ncbi:MAG: chromate efflux transporter [Ignavibacteriales bacterium]|nr:chromate efflux transporter [Ignavibacteriales bacterium]
MTTNSQPSLLKLFTSFLRLGLTAFGGPSMVAYIRKMAVEEEKWIDKETFSNGVALCQVIPGATAMQSAAYVGLKTRGVAGAAATFIGFGLPAFFLMSMLAAVYKLVINLPVTVFIFSCLQAIIVAIIANATISFSKVTLKEWRSVLITIIAIVLFGLKINPIIIIVLSAVIGILLRMKNQISKQQVRADISLAQDKTKSYNRQIIFILLTYLVLLLALYILDKNLLVLSTLMFRIDLFAFGGGLASVPLMFHEIVDVRHLLDNKTFMDGIALGQVTPGPIVITATFIGYLLAGSFGAIVGTVSIFLPSFLMLIGITPIFDKLRTQKLFNEIIRGVLSSFVGLLFTITIQFALNLHWGAAQISIGATALIALLLKTDILYVVLVGIALSVTIFFII